MENAGQGIAAWIREIFRDNVRGKHFAIVCGKGNNGGDGYVIARYLHQWGAVPQVFMLAAPDEIKGDALTNLQRIQELGMTIHRPDKDNRIWIPAFAGMTGRGEAGMMGRGEAGMMAPEGMGMTTSGRTDFTSYDMVVDAIFGTGFTGGVDPAVGMFIEAINSSGATVLAVDTPSGLNCDTGEQPKSCIRATYTATLALPKIGHYFYPGRSYCGITKTIDIGIPAKALEGLNLSVNLTTPWQVRDLIPDREPTAHKGDAGKLFIVAGSVGMTGAATLAAQAAVKSGCGLVTVGCPKSLNDILEIKLTEAMTRPLPEVRSTRCLALHGLGDILQGIRNADAACLGPGVGRHHDTKELFKRLIASLDRPAVLDADGLYPFSGQPELLKACKADLVLTPHVGEFSRLSGLSAEEINQDRIRAASDFPSATGKVILLTGAPTIIATPDCSSYINTTGNPGVANGGSGDVLSGLIGALLAFRMGAYEAAICGAFIHGWAGDLAQRVVGTFGMSASDISNQIPKALKVLKS